LRLRLAVLAACAGVLLSACSVVKPSLYEQLDGDKAALWEAFRNHTGAGRPGEPVRISAALYYFGKTRKNRTTINLWGVQGEAMRLDVQAGFGTLVSAWLERRDYFLAYFPNEEVAYASRDLLAGQETLGLPLPLTLLDLADLAMGRLDAMAPAQYDRAEETLTGVRYFFDTGPLASLSLDKKGRPVAAAGRAPVPYRIEIDEYPEKKDGFAERIAVKTDEASALLRVKSLEHRIEPWPEQALELKLPKNTRIIWLEGEAPQGALKSGS
jgi:hypothetical protein